MICDAGHCVFSILELPHVQNEDDDNVLPHGILRVTRNCKAICKHKVSMNYALFKLPISGSTATQMEWFHPGSAKTDKVEREGPSWLRTGM